MTSSLISEDESSVNNSFVENENEMSDGEILDDGANNNNNNNEEENKENENNKKEENENNENFKKEEEIIIKENINELSEKTITITENIKTATTTTTTTTTTTEFYYIDTMNENELINYQKNIEEQEKLDHASGYSEHGMVAGNNSSNSNNNGNGNIVLRSSGNGIVTYNTPIESIPYPSIVGDRLYMPLAYSSDRKEDKDIDFEESLRDYKNFKEKKRSRSYSSDKSRSRSRSRSHSRRRSRHSSYSSDSDRSRSRSYSRDRYSSSKKSSSSSKNSSSRRSSRRSRSSSTSRSRSRSRDNKRYSSRYSSSSSRYSSSRYSSRKSRSRSRSYSRSRRSYSTSSSRSRSRRGSRYSKSSSKRSRSSSYSDSSRSRSRSRRGSRRSRSRSRSRDNKYSSSSSKNKSSSSSSYSSSNKKDDKKSSSSSSSISSTSTSSISTTVTENNHSLPPPPPPPTNLNNNNFNHNNNNNNVNNHFKQQNQQQYQQQQQQQQYNLLVPNQQQFQNQQLQYQIPPNYSELVGIKPNQQTSFVTFLKPDGSWFDFDESEIQTSKMHLIVDIDHTLIHATKDPQGESYFLKDKSIHKITFPETNETFYVKERPNAIEFLKTLSSQFNIYVYSFHPKYYVERVASILDPHSNIFSKVISKEIIEFIESPIKITRDNNNSQKPFIIFNENNVPKIFKIEDLNKLIILDDREDVWRNFQDNLILLDTFKYFNREVIDFTPIYQYPFSFQELSRAFPFPNITESINNNNFNNNLNQIIKSQQLQQREHQQLNGGVVNLESFVPQPNINFLLSNQPYLDMFHNLLGAMQCEYVSRQTTDQSLHIKSIIQEIKSSVLMDCNIVFSGIFPKQIDPSKLCHTRVSKITESFGATISQEIDSKTTHVIFIKEGTSKVLQALKIPSIKVVHFAWLRDCIHRWEKIDESNYSVNSYQNLLKFN